MPRAAPHYDYIIIGAGSAGSVLANRLSADPATTVLLLEAGGRNASMLVKMPAGAGTLIKQKSAQNWGFWTEPEAELENRKLWWPRGKGLGGSSAINGMIYIRGHAGDYDQWRQMGLSGWSYADVLPYFKRAETLEDGADDFHGGDGPLRVSTGQAQTPITAAFLQAGAEAGYPATDDFNGAEQEGFGRYQLTLSDGQRWSAARSYLDPILKARPNLSVVTGARTTRIRIENGRATGVEYVLKKGGAVHTVHADAEVLLSAGAVQSPQILQLSGIGDADALRALDVKPLHDLKGVGQNLQDHLDLLLSWETPGYASAYSYVSGLEKLKTGLNYMLLGQGPGRRNFLEAGAFLKSRPDLDRPDLQLHFLEAIMIDHGKVDPPADGFSIHVCQLRPESRGEIGLRSADPFDDPKIEPRYMTASEDRRALREGFNMVRDLVGQPALKAIIGREFAPGESVKTDADIDAWIRSHAESLYHPVSTCRMGQAGDPMAVVDERLKVMGLDGLRVVDASVMPTLIGGNTNAPTIMIAEKAADMVLGRG
jgi:choline dehydrogenase